MKNKTEKLEEYLARGGKITKVPEGAAHNACSLTRIMGRPTNSNLARINLNSHIYSYGGKDEK